MMPAVEQTDCGRCGSVLRQTSAGVLCGCEEPMYGGMVQLRADGSASCDACGWEGMPTYVKGRWSTHCPRCEGFGDEFDLAKEPLAYDLHIRRDGIYRIEDGYLVSCAAQKLHTPKQGRNEPCACGSGKKFKKCCGA